ncbi:MAG: MarR family transcriptional regulator [Candidatus Atribacteria bacterium]|nr:MarR family transcriptional regulator [Candidatus Atribacteria bacterium]
MDVINEDLKLGAEIDDLFIGLLEIMWEHVSGAYVSSETTSFNITEHYLVEFLGKKQNASMSELSNIFHVVPTTMTSIVDRLLRKGYLKRVHSEEDRRVVLVGLSEQGKKYYQRHREESVQVFSNLISRLPDKGKKFCKSLRGLNESLLYLRKNHKA